MASIVNTQSKILAAASNSPATLDAAAQFVLLYLDPLTQSHAGRLEQIAAGNGGQPLVAVLLNPPDELLPERARAELAASLACVQQVITGADEAWIAALPPARCLDERAADLARREALMQHVAARHALA